MDIIKINIGSDSLYFKRKKFNRFYGWINVDRVDISENIDLDIPFDDLLLFAPDFKVVFTVIKDGITIEKVIINSSEVFLSAKQNYLEKGCEIKYSLNTTKPCPPKPQDNIVIKFHDKYLYSIDNGSINFSNLETALRLTEFNDALKIIQRNNLMDVLLLQDKEE